MKRVMFGSAKEELTHDIGHLPSVDVAAKYGLELDDDGSVWCTTMCSTFASIQDWVDQYSILLDDDQEPETTFHKMPKRVRFDDDNG